MIVKMAESSMERVNNALYSTTYVDNFFDTIENLPDEVQREISYIRELDIRYQNLLAETGSLRSQCELEPESVASKKFMSQIQIKLIYLQEIGDEKLQRGQLILDMIENKQRQLDSDCKNLDLDHNEDQAEVSKEPQPERASKRARRTRADNSSINNENSSDSTSLPSVERPVLRTPGTRGSVQKKGPKKKKRKTRTVEQEIEPDSPTEVPIDPNEPTYCLCEQVSYGEMIGCDNDLCPIEWFHFSCVNLTNKPKGKWYCPKCRADKPTIMKPRAQFLKELQKYNKDHEERS